MSQLSPDAVHAGKDAVHAGKDAVHAGKKAPAPTKRAQVRDLLSTLIEESLHPGEAIPSERALVTDLAVSRVTVRQAIADLVEDGRLERVHGKGTFVTGPQINSQLHLASFSREMRARGLEPATQVLDACQVSATDALVPKLRVRPGAPVFRVERLRLADGTPMAHEIGFYPAAVFPGLLSRCLDALYDVFAHDYGVSVTSGVQTVWSEAADADHAQILHIPRKSPLLVQERVTLCGETPVEAVTSWYHADRYRLRMRITPHGSAT